MFSKKLARILPRFVSSFLPIIIAVLLTACGSGGGGENTDPGTTNNNESNSIGPNGGTVTSSDGKAKIVLPSGALNQDTGITVAIVSNQLSGNIDTAYEFGPDGTAFNKPVTISITYDDASLPSGVSESDIKLGMITNNQWQEITNSDVDTVANIVSGTTSHLSIYGVIAVSNSGTEPSAPSGVVASAGDGYSNMSWNAVSKATSYNIYWATTSVVSKTSYTGKITGVTSPYLHTGLLNDTTYYYIVTAVNGYGESSESSQVSATPASTVFPDTTAPLNTTASNFINSGAASTNSMNVTLSLSATDIVGVIGYYVSEISGTPSASAAGWVAVTSVTSYTTNVSFSLSSGDGPKTLYVWFKDAAGNVSTLKSDTITLDTTAPSNPTTISGYSSSSKIATITSGNWYSYDTPYFEWSGASDSSSGVAGYYVYFGTDATADPATSGTYQTLANYTVSSTLTSGSAYYLLIKARDNAGNIATGTYTAFTYQYDSSGPTNTTGNNFIDSGASSTNSTTVTLTLSATDNAGVTGYCAKESSAAPSGNDPCWTLISSVTSYSAGITFTLSSLEGTKTVYVWFKDAAGNISSVANDSITLGSPPSAPTGISVIAGNGQVTISWNTVSVATSYNIYWSTASGVTKSNGTKISNVTHPYTHTGRDNGTTYYYVVTAVNSFGESSESSQVSVTTETNVPIFTSSPVTTAQVNTPYVYDVNATDEDGDLLTYSLTTAPSNMIIESTTGVIYWTPTAGGLYSIVVSVSDGNGGTATQGFTISVVTNVSGIVAANTTWKLTNCPYVVTGNILVNSGVTLTIEPGCTVKFDSGKALQVDGALIARGNSTNKITITSNQSTPAPGDWGYIYFTDTSTDATYDISGNYTGGSILEHCIVEYAGSAGVGAIYARTSQPFVNYCTIRNNSASGIYAILPTGNFKITNNIITNNTTISAGGGINYNQACGGTATISNNIITDNITTSSSLYGNGGGIYYTYWEYCTSSGLGMITNNTITGNSAIASSYYYAAGGGIYASGTVTINNNTITGNTASAISADAAYGGGIRANWGAVTISNNIILNNTVTAKSYSYGGGVSSSASSGSIVTDNIIVGNNAYAMTYYSVGGGIESNSILTMMNNIIAQNDATNGGGIYQSGQVNIMNNSITGNTATDGGGVYSVPTSGFGMITNNTITGNTANYGGGVSSEGGTINNNNMFANSIYELTNISTNTDATNNWWGTTAESEIQAKIYDWFDDFTKSIVEYSPWDSSIRSDTPISPPAGLTTTTGNGQITMNWSANPELDSAGYKVYWGVSQGSYINSVDVGNVTNYIVQSLPSGTYYIAVTAYDTNYNPANDNTNTIVNDNQTAGNESWYAVEQVVNVP